MIRGMDGCSDGCRGGAGELGPSTIHQLDSNEGVI